MGQLVSVALLSLIKEACVNVGCATLLPSELIGPSCMEAQSSNPRGRTGRPNWKGSGEEGILSDVVPVYTAQLLVSVFLWVSNPGMHADRPPKTTQHTLHCQPRPNLAVCVDRAYRQPTNMQPGTFCCR